MDVVALTFGPPTQASSLFRIHQYREPLARLGIRLRAGAADDAASWEGLEQADVVILQKKLLGGRKLGRLRDRARRLVYDIDDAIWCGHGKEHSWWTRWRTWRRLRAVAGGADLVLAANRVIAAGLEPWARRLEVFPMALDERRWRPAPARAPGTEVVVGWSGHPVNLPFLEGIEPALRRVAEAVPGVRFRVLSGEAPRFRSLDCEHVPFCPGEEEEVLRGFDVGLLPLDQSPFSAGKSPIKGIQYLATGIPSVVTPHGAARELFEEGATGWFARDEGEWAGALVRLCRDAGERHRMGTAARAAFEARHALSTAAERLAALLRGLQGEP
jgi:glycosyltransferase involved in cell wall biosynthesis